MTSFTGKKVAVLGLGMEGQDLCRYLLKKKAKITVFDQKNASELGDVYKKFKKSGVNFILGKNYLTNGLTGFSFIFRSPGIKRNLPEILTAEKKGVIVSSATKLFFSICRGKIIGVTGTKGKGTTATLIYQILKADQKDVFLAGNIGAPMLSLLPKIKPSSRVVLELSSFQLQDMAKSPHISVVLFVTSEHLDYHRDTKEYRQAKLGIVRYQTKRDYAVLNADDRVSASFARRTPAQIFFFSRQKKVKGAFVKDQKIYLKQALVGPTSKLQIRGQHNWENITAAITAAHLAGASLSSIRKAVFIFKGLKHRLELIRELGGVKYFNDSFSTTPETAIAAIRAFTDPVVLIAGGSPKGSDFTQLGREIACSTVKTLILIGQEAEKIMLSSQKAGFKGKIILQPRTMKKIIQLSFKEAKVGDIVLLSPACASFDMFANYKERGDLFRKHVQAI